MAKDLWDDVQHRYADAAGVRIHWEWVEQDLTIVTVPGASHFVQQDAAQFVSDTMVDWLARRKK